LGAIVKKEILQSYKREPTTKRISIKYIILQMAGKHEYI